MDTQTNDALLKLFAASGLGFVIQWALFGPKNVKTWIAWSALAGATVLIYWWMTPTAFSDFTANWRYTVVSIISFFLTAKGTGASAKAAKVAPPTNSL